MLQSIRISGLRTASHLAVLEESLVEVQPTAVGVAAAFVSVRGVQQFSDVLTACGGPKCRLVAGIDGDITHPEALSIARELGWHVRLGEKRGAIFHPKLIVAGDRFRSDDRVRQLSYVYVGSSNLTAAGLQKNVECGLSAIREGCVTSAALVFARLWRSAAPATNSRLKDYARRFAERARRRRPEDLRDLGVADWGTESASTRPTAERTPPKRAAMPLDVAVGAWAGLESFTGEFRFQVEFPQQAGRVIGHMLRDATTHDGRLELYSPVDTHRWPMQYRFYDANGMFRLNVPNEFPGVAWARANHAGLAIVERRRRGVLSLRLVKPGGEARALITRSTALGTWGRTTTRLYGWF